MGRWRKKSTEHSSLRIKKVITDVDGTITDGRHYFNAVEKEDPYLIKNFEPHLGDAFDLSEEIGITIEIITSGFNGLRWSRRLGEHFPVRIKEEDYCVIREVKYVTRQERRDYLRKQSEPTLFLCDSYKDLEDVKEVNNHFILPVASPVTDWRIACELEELSLQNAFRCGVSEIEGGYGWYPTLYKEMTNPDATKAGFLHAVMYSLKLNNR